MERHPPGPCDRPAASSRPSRETSPVGGRGRRLWGGQGGPEMPGHGGFGAQRLDQLLQQRICLAPGRWRAIIVRSSLHPSLPFWTKSKRAALVVEPVVGPFVALCLANLVEGEAPKGFWRLSNAPGSSRTCRRCSLCSSPSRTAMFAWTRMAAAWSSATGSRWDPPIQNRCSSSWL